MVNSRFVVVLEDLVQNILDSEIVFLSAKNKSIFAVSYIEESGKQILVITPK